MWGERERETRIYCAFKAFIVLSYIILKFQLNNNRLHRTLAIKHRHLPPPNVNLSYIPRGASTFNIGPISVRIRLRTTWIGTCRAWFRCWFRGSLGGFIILYHLNIIWWIYLFQFAICFYSRILFECEPASVCVRWNTDIQTLFFVRPFSFGSTIHNFHFSACS